MPLYKRRIPEFRQDGYLPEGMFLATEAEVTFRFGTSNRRRRRLTLRVRRWIVRDANHRERLQPV